MDMSLEDIHKYIPGAWTDVANTGILSEIVGSYLCEARNNLE